MNMNAEIVRKFALVIGALFLASACEPPPEPGDPLPDLTQEQLKEFEQGREVFNRVFTQETGLGPLFNADSCVECHEDPVAGGPGDEVELHATRLDENGFCDPLIESGGPVFQLEVTALLNDAMNIDSEPIPDNAERADRSTPDVFGFGLLDTVPDATLLDLADPNDDDDDGISGRVGRDFSGKIGRFGRKAFVATLQEFNEGAFQIEQGVTTPNVAEEGTVGDQPIPDGVDPLPEPEIDADSVRLVDAFVRFLAPPAPLELSSAARHGRRIFSDIGCAACHVPSLHTGDNEVAALAYKEVQAYTDLLLHDMGPELADICFGPVATRSEFRTEPLMGLRLSQVFLHDGRADSIEAAIIAHGGEGAASRDAFLKLTPAERDALLTFLRSL